MLSTLLKKNYVIWATLKSCINAFCLNKAKTLLYIQGLPFPKQGLFFFFLQYKSWKRYSKRRNCLWWAISPFHSVFYPIWELYTILSNSKWSSANSFSLEESEICGLGMGWIGCIQISETVIFWSHRNRGTDCINWTWNFPLILWLQRTCSTSKYWIKIQHGKKKLKGTFFRQSFNDHLLMET